ncbi:MAG: lycopene beta-cyclase CrtY, partial [Pantoea sp.]|nr:lycopene beta-cyclase CrtY [Pantoea sp.]
MPSYDLILVGAGLANGLIALRLRQQHPSLRILLIDAERQPGAGHTWSFHAEDLSETQHRWIAPLVVHHWPGYQVRFPHRTRSLNSGYFCVTAERFAAVMHDRFQQDLMLDTRVESVASRSVTLADGRSLEASAVIDGRGYQPEAALRMGFQAFVGQEWQLAAPHGLQQPILMDASVDQQQGYRFVYTLPLSASRLLIEDTHYINHASLDAAQARRHIADYAHQRGWNLSQLLREEHGSLPITLSGDIDQFWQQQHGQPCSGLRAGLLHATTGHSLPAAVALA